MPSKRPSAPGSSEPSPAADPLRDFIEAVIDDPLGFVASVPERLAKGKAKIESQTKTANMIGKFVVPIAKRKIDAELKAAAESVRSYLTSTEPKRGPKPASDPKPASEKASAAKTSGASSLRSIGKAGFKVGSGHPSLAAPTGRITGTDSVPSDAKKNPAKAGKSTKTKPTAVARKAGAAPEGDPVPKVSSVPKAKPKTGSKAEPKASPGTQRETRDRSVRVSSAGAAPATPAVPSALDTGLDGYDDLPASSIVGLLEALTVTQLRSIAAYESSHRNRQTVLGGVARLLDAAK
jgi:hypothetical protein